MTDELRVGDMGGQVCVQQGAERQAVVPAAAEVGHVNVLTDKGKRKGEMERESQSIQRSR